MSLSESSILISCAKNSRNLKYPLRNVPRVVKRYIYSCLLRLFLPPLDSLAPSYISRKNANDSPRGGKKASTYPSSPPFFFSPHVSTAWIGKTATETILLIRDRRANPANRCRYNVGDEEGGTGGEGGDGENGRVGGVAKSKVDQRGVSCAKKIAASNMETRHRRGPRRSAFAVKCSRP